MRIANEGYLGLLKTVELIKICILAIIYTHPPQRGCGYDDIVCHEIFAATSNYIVTFSLNYLLVEGYVACKHNRWYITSGGRSFLLSSYNKFNLTKKLFAIAFKERGRYYAIH